MIILQILLILVFLLTATTMLLGLKFQIESFKQLRLPQWFRIFTAIVQLFGVAGLVIGFWLPEAVAWAGFWLALTMLAACIAHAKVRDPFGKMVPAIVLAATAIVLTV